MWAVFIPNQEGDRSRWYEGLGNAQHPVAWFDERDHAVAFAKWLMAERGTFATAAYLPEDYVTGTGYVGEVVR